MEEVRGGSLAGDEKQPDRWEEKGRSLVCQAVFQSEIKKDQNRIPACRFISSSTRIVCSEYFRYL